MFYRSRRSVKAGNLNIFSDGVVFANFYYIPEKSRLNTENWLFIQTTQDGDYQVYSNGIEENKFIISALILSFIFAIFVGGTVFILFKAAVMMVYVEACEKSEHLKNYVELENGKQKKSESPIQAKPFDIWAKFSF